MSERQKVLEASEALISSASSQWLGGLFESGGSLHFEIKIDKNPSGEYQYAYPRVSVGDNNVDKLEVLKKYLVAGFLERKIRKGVKKIIIGY
ncbi:MAG: hypothetical protein NTZ93_01810 [Candidatus Beckwithbacteria bacterium]|nr:hypothetical protein [Candidatus Beckwithbacteria bacterium]